MKGDVHRNSGYRVAQLSVSMVLAFLVASSPNPLAQSQAASSELEAIHEALLQLERTAPLEESLDYGSASRLEMRSQLIDLRRRLAAIDLSGAGIDERVDYLLVVARSNAILFQLDTVRPWERDPGFYLDPISRLPHADGEELTQPEPAWLSRVQAVPQWLQQARQNLTMAARDLADLALFHLDKYDGVGQSEPLRSDPPPGLRGWYSDLAERCRQQKCKAQAEIDAARAAVDSFASWLRQQRPSLRSSAAVGLGHYEWFMQNVRLMPFTVDQVRTLGLRELHRSRTFLEIERNRNRQLPELELAASKAEYEGRVTAAEERIRDLIRQQQLMSVPEGLGPFETDAFWRAGLKRHFWEEIQYRDAHNNHVHASIPGHRLDMAMASKLNHPIRSATRDGGRIEGWAFYIEEMLLQAGLVDGSRRARELFYVAQLARAVRIPTELGLQSGELTLQEAIDYMVREVPLMEENLARYDLEVYLRRPTYGMNYVMGRLQLEELLSRRSQALAEEFDLGNFHDRFLAQGLIPIELIGWLLNGWDAAAQDFFDARRADLIEQLRSEDPGGSQ